MDLKKHKFGLFPPNINVMKAEEIAQWVIDNRYAKSENQKMSDAEMYHTLVEKITGTWKDKKMEPTSTLKKTNDDWCGNIDEHYCNLEYLGELTDGLFRVAVWGNDDFGIDQDFKTEQEAINMYNNLNSYDIINHKDLYDLGFTRF